MMTGGEMSETIDKRNLLKKTEGVLYAFKDIDIKIKSIEIDIEALKNDITLQAVQYEEKSAPTNAFNSSVENEVIRRDEKVMQYIKRLEKDKYLHQTRREKIKLALEALSAEDRKLIELRYFSKPRKSWTEVGYKLNKDKDNCCRARKKIINTLSYYIFNV